MAGRKKSCGERYRLVCVGGTFDQLHIGHKTLLSTASSLGKRVVVGLCSDEMAKKEKNYRVQPFEIRKKKIEGFLEKIAGKRFEVVKISDTLGSAKDMEELEAIVVSPQTFKGALMINHARRRRGLHPLDIIVVRLVVDDLGRVFSSTRIKKAGSEPG